VILLGRDKVGKSILAQQMAFNMSCGEPFLGEYPTEQICTLYVQVEGKLRGKGATYDRIVSMEEAVAWNQKNFNLIYRPGLLMNTDEGMKIFQAMIERKLNEGMPRPKLIIFDPLYMCMLGDISSQPDSSRMCTNLRVISDTYDCAIMLIHHEHREKYNEKGAKLDEGSGSIFGSFVWSAFPDHVLLFRRIGGPRSLVRELTCDVQRSGAVKDKLELTFVEPVPLCFELKGEVEPYIKVVESQLNDKPITAEEIHKATNLSYHSVNKALVWLRKGNKVKSVCNGYPKLWVRC
jgi:hypothetical protein